MTIDWPDNAYGQPLAIETFINRAAVFKDGGNVDNAKAFVRFLVGEGWLAHYLNFSGGRMLPTMPKLLEAPFWLDPSDPHRMRSAMQMLTMPRSRLVYPFRSAAPAGGPGGGLAQGRSSRCDRGRHPEQAVDEAIARVKQILAEHQLPGGAEQLARSRGDEVLALGVGIIRPTC